LYLGEFAEGGLVDVLRKGSGLLSEPEGVRMPTGKRGYHWTKA